MKTFIELFTSPTCPYCPAAKRVASESVGLLREKGEEIELNIFDVSTSLGSIKANEYGITHVPTLVVYAETGQKILIEGSPAKESLQRAIRIAQGKEIVPKKNGILSKINSLFK